MCRSGVAVVLVGVHDVRPPAGVFAAFPGASATRVFVGPGPLPVGTDLVARVEAACRDTLAAGGVPVVSVKLLPVDVNAGLWDGGLRKLGAWLAKHPQVIVVAWHEPENDFQTPNAARVFAAAFNRVRALLKGVSPGTAVACCAMAYQWRPGSKTTADPAVWRAIDADLYLVDVYSGKSFPASAILPEHAGFRRWKTEMVDAVPGRRWGVGERGILAGPTRAATWTRERDWLSGPGRDCAVYMVWNTPGREGEDRWVQRNTYGADGDGGEMPAVRDLVAALALPPGYRPVDGDNLVVCETTGAVVARSMAARHKAWRNETTAKE